MQNDSQGKKPPGRPLAYAQQDAPMSNYSARLTAWHARHARRAGDGSLSAGLRLLIEEYVLRNKKPAE